MKRILYLSRGGDTGGSQRQLHYVLAALDRDRYEPVVVCREGGPFVDRLRGEGVETHVALLRPWRTWPAATLRFVDVRRLVRLARRQGAALVHSSDLWLSGYLLGVARKRKVPSVLHVRTPLPPEQVDKHRCGRATALVAISNRVRDDLRRAGVADEKITVIYDAVDVERFHPRPAAANVLRRDFPQADGVLVGVVGRIDLFKRQFDFLRSALRLVARDAGGATFFVVGEAHDRDYHRQVRCLAERGSLNGRVVFTGRREDTPEVLASLDVLVTLSGGSVMTEAMACGTPVISAGFTRPEQSTIVQDGRTGLLAASVDGGDLDAALVRLIRDAALRERLGRQARRHAEAHFSHRDLAAATQGLYDRLLGA